MGTCLRTLLTDIIDYAGLFPPASLRLEPAIRNYARYLGENESWMLARFICPAARLDELAPFVPELFGADSKLRLSILGRGGETCRQHAEGTRDAMTALTEFHARHGDRVSIGAFEVRLPGEAYGADGTAPLVAIISELCDVCHVDRVPLFIESAGGDDLPSMWSATIEALAECRESLGAGGESGAASLGFKLRCGGVTASAFPSVAEVVRAIRQSSDLGVPIKFTAGLHHPLPHYDKDIQANMHGFLGVFAASLFARQNNLSDDRLADVLTADTVAPFRFTADGLSFEDMSIDQPELERLRREAVISFGSCSFDEPRDDLRALGLL